MSGEAKEPLAGARPTIAPRPLEDRVAIVTGGNSGIGRAAAHALAEAGARVVVAARRRDAGEQVVAEIAGRGGAARFVPTDVTDPTQVERLVADVMARERRLDIAFNNAGGGRHLGPLESQSPEAWRDELDTNLSSVFYALRHEIPAMRDTRSRLGTRGGTIINNASQLGVVGIGGAALYVAAKHGVVGLTRAAALEQATSGLRVNALVTGGVDTPLFRTTMGATPEGAAAIAALHPVNRVATPEEIASFVVYLATDAAAFITGAALAIDGGWTAR